MLAAGFWANLLLLVSLLAEPVSWVGPVVLALAACLSSAAFIYGAVWFARKLEAHFEALAMIAGRSDFVRRTDLEFVEFEAVAAAVQAVRRSYRDEIEILQRAAFRDAATGLPNLLSLLSFLERWLPKSNFGNPAALLHLRVDGFDRVGDALGAAATQRLQQAIASRMSLFLATLTADEANPLQDVFIAARSPSEYNIFVPGGCGRQEASRIARDLRLLFDQPFEIDGRTLSVGISGGIAMAPDDGDMPDTLLKNAAMALDEIVRAGRTRMQFFTPRLERLAVGRQRFEQELRKAVEQKAFRPAFQPKISFQTGKVVGVEALARWHRGEDRMISPATFIPLAEELGLIDEIGFQILRQACRSAAAWMRAGHEITVAVNVAPSQFDRNDFVDQILDALLVSGLPPRLLELEITETMAVSNPERVKAVMQPLRTMGIKLAIDDFGTGHANLSLLAQLPFDIFKIDRQFVSALEEDSQAPAIVEMILVMAETLGLQTVAEGVETEAQASFLRRRGCTLGQGFLFSRPILDSELSALLERWQLVAEAG